MATVTGGDRLQRKLADMARKSGGSVSVGFHTGDTYPTGQPLALVAAINEYGAPGAGIPPRPFMRITIAKHKGEWPEQVVARFKYHDGDVQAALADMGEVIAGEIQDTIRSNVPPPNSPRTAARKGFSATLRDTGFMLQHVRYVVTDE